MLGPAAGDVPLALLGGPLLQSDYTILDLIEQAGGWLGLDATEGGERTIVVVETDPSVGWSEVTYRKA